MRGLLEKDIRLLMHSKQTLYVLLHWQLYLVLLRKAHLCLAI